MGARSVCIIFLTLVFLSCVKEPQLVVYTSRNEHLIRELFDQYQKISGTKVQLKTGEPGALIQALKSEGASTPADLFMTVDAGNLWFAASENLLEPVDSEILKNNIPEHLRDPDNQWFSLSIRARPIVYSTERVNPAELSSYENLADEKWKQRLCLRTSKKVYNQSLIAMMIAMNGYEETLQTVQGWMRNTLEVFNNDTAVIKAIAAGQCDIGIVNTYYLGRLQVENPELPVKIFWPNQDDSYGAHINISGAGVVKHSQNKAEALKFLEWLSSAEAQKTFAQINLEYAILTKEVQQDPLVMKWGNFRPNTLFDLADSGRLQAQAIKLINEARYP
jgi:iron(III) transport system substrate-binding protein